MRLFVGRGLDCGCVMFKARYVGLPLSSLVYFYVHGLLSSFGRIVSTVTSIMYIVARTPLVNHSTVFSKPPATCSSWILHACVKLPDCVYSEFGCSVDADLCDTLDDNGTLTLPDNGTKTSTGFFTPQLCVMGVHINPMLNPGFPGSRPSVQQCLVGERNAGGVERPWPFAD